MKAGYIDTSFLLSILFKDENYALSVKTWNNLDIHLGSLLLEIESRINVYKYCVKTIKNKELFREKDKLLSWHLSGIHRKNIDAEILLEIRNNDKLKEVKSLDGIHLATAGIFNTLLGNNLLVCSYDAKMSKAAAALGMSTLKDYNEY